MMRKVMMRKVMMGKVMMMMNKGRKGREGKESLLGVGEGDGEFNSVRSREEGAGFFLRSSTVGRVGLDPT